MAFFLFVMLLLSHGVIDRAMDSSVTIYADQLDDQGNVVQDQPTCSGFVVRSERGDDVIATARHCVQDGVSDRDVRFMDGDVGRIEGVMPSNDADAAILIVHSMRSHRAVRFAHSINPGDRCFTIGMPSGDEFSYNTLYSRNGSRVFDVTEDPNSTDMVPEIAFEGPAIYEGDSGAAVFESNGDVIGVIDGMGGPSYPGVVYAAPVSYIRRLF